MSISTKRTGNAPAGNADKVAGSAAFPDRVRALPLSALLDKLKELGASDRLLDFAKKSRRR